MTDAIGVPRAVILVAAVVLLAMGCGNAVSTNLVS